jgi:hypothetical protein
MMALRKYLNPILREADSLNYFMKAVKKENIKRIDVTLEDTDVIQESREGQYRKRITTDIRTKYEATLPYKRKIRFIKNHSGMSQLEAIAYTGRRVEWLKNKLPNTTITFKNMDGKDITVMYSIMLALANESLKTEDTK